MKLGVYLFLSLLCATLIYSQDPMNTWFSIGFWGLLYLVWGMLGMLSALSAPALVLAIRHVDIDSPDLLLGIICPLTIVLSSSIILIYIGFLVAEGSLRFSQNYTLFTWQRKKAQESSTP